MRRGAWKGALWGCLAFPQLCVPDFIPSCDFKSPRQCHPKRIPRSAAAAKTPTKSCDVLEAWRVLEAGGPLEARLRRAHPDAYLKKTI